MDLYKAVRDPWVWGQLLLMIIVVVGVPLIVPHLSTGRMGREIQVLGGAALLVGAMTAVSAVRELGANLTPGTEPLAGSELVTTGPYATVRHPIYTAVILLLTGYALMWCNWIPGLVVFVIALAYFEGKARREERWLRERFPDYAVYRAGTSRLLPGLW